MFVAQLASVKVPRGDRVPVWIWMTSVKTIQAARGERTAHWFWKAFMSPAPIFVARTCMESVKARQAARGERTADWSQKMPMLPPPAAPEDVHAPPAAAQAKLLPEVEVTEVAAEVEVAFI